MAPPPAMDEGEANNQDDPKKLSAHNSRQDFVIPAHWAHFLAGGCVDVQFIYSSQLTRVGSIGGSAAAFLTCPLEVIKTRLQAGQLRSTSSKTPFGSRLTTIAL